MTCPSARAALLELPPDALGGPETPPELAAHLASCASCASLAEVLRARHADLDRALGAASEPPASLTSDPNPTFIPANRPWRPVMTALALAAAVLGTFTVALAPPADPAPASAAPCAIDGKMEARAMVGKLTDADLTCLRTAFDADGKETAGRMLAVHYWSSDQEEAWEAVVTAILLRAPAGKADPDLAYKLALHHAKRGDHPEALDFSAIALDRGSAWSEELRAKRVTSLLKVRAAAQLAIWRAAVAAGKDGKAEQLAALEAAKAMIAHLRATGQDTKEAAELCAAAGGSSADCAP